METASDGKALAPVGNIFEYPQLRILGLDALESGVCVIAAAIIDDDEFEA
jgi:hypothetical protein